MTDTDELADLRARLKQLERRQARAAGEVEATQRLLLARLLVVIATVALFLSISMAWYADVEVDEESYESVSGWRLFTGLAGDDEGALVFAGIYSLIAVLVALVAGATVFTVQRRWLPITMATLLGLLGLGQLLLNLDDSADDERLAGLWCAIVVMLAAAFAWGHLVVALRELAEVEQIANASRKLPGR